MTSTSSRFAGVLRILIVAVAIVAVSLALVVGRATAEPAPELTVGEPSPELFRATQDVTVTDDTETEALRQVARNSVDPIFQDDPNVKFAVRGDIAQFFQRARQAAEPLVPATTTTTSTTTTSTSTTTTTTLPDEEPGAETTTTTTTTLPPTTTTTTTTLPPPPFETQLEALRADYGRRLSDETLTAFLEVLNLDLDNRSTEAPTDYFGALYTEVDEIAVSYLDRGVQSGDLTEVKSAILDQPPQLLVTGLDEDLREATRLAAADLVAEYLQANRTRDLAAEQQEADRLAAAVEPVERTFQEGQIIVREGELLTDVAVDAITRLGLAQPAQSTPLFAVAAIATLVVLLAAFFLWRVAPDQWVEPKLVALLAILLVLAALVARVPETIASEEIPALAYLMPAALVGYLAAILFSPRTALLMSVPVGAFTAVTTGDAGLTLFAATTTIVPVGFVSSASSRRQLRLAVVYSAATIAPIAAAVEWLFVDTAVLEQVSFLGIDGADAGLLRAAALGFLGGIIAGLVAQGLLSFLENAFGVTTTSTLLDLTDRNHPALRLLEEKAPGTFNHSILVGTLAGKAARRIEADPLLAQAAAYYHDLGKTENPLFYIENQVGISNPHDDLTPVESAEIIRRHVTDGLRLARQFRIPQDVAQGILMHHGNGLMRYFYHQALEQDPGVDPALFRHHGVRPRKKEMAIIMLCDAIEGAARAMVQHEDPTTDSIRKLVDQIVQEKVDDGQLDESDLTYGDLTEVKAALVDALIGYYHTRISYPGFPGREVPAG